MTRTESAVLRQRIVSLLSSRTPIGEVARLTGLSVPSVVYHRTMHERATGARLPRTTSAPGELTTQAQAVARLCDGTRTISHIARLLGMTGTEVRQWRRRAKRVTGQELPIKYVNARKGGRPETDSAFLRKFRRQKRCKRCELRGCNACIPDAAHYTSSGASNLGSAA